MKHAAEVIIAGGGIAGLAVAIALRQRGVEALVLEQAPELREIGAGLLLGPNACAVLERLGALPELLNGNSVPVARWELRNWRGKLVSSMAIPKPHETSISTRRSDLQAALVRQLPSDAMRLDCHVSDASLGESGVLLTLADGRRLSAPRLIIADGSDSVTRSSLWPDREPRYTGYVGWRGIVDHVPAGREEGRVTESWGRGRRFGIAPVGGGRTYWYATASIPESRCREKVPLEQLKHDFGGWHDPVAEILAAMPKKTLLQHPIADRRPHWTWQREGKAVLIGDAAHPLTPNLGQGAAMALEDAWELAALWDRPDAMACFQKKRRLRVMTLWAISRHLGKLIQWENPILCGMRDLHMRATPDRLTTAAMRRLLHYRPAMSAP